MVVFCWWTRVLSDSCASTTISTCVPAATFSCKCSHSIEKSCPVEKPVSRCQQGVASSPAYTNFERQVPSERLEIALCCLLSRQSAVQPCCTCKLTVSNYCEPPRQSFINAIAKKPCLLAFVIPVEIATIPWSISACLNIAPITNIALKITTCWELDSEQPLPSRRATHAWLGLAKAASGRCHGSSGEPVSNQQSPALMRGVPCHRLLDQSASSLHTLTALGQARPLISLQQHKFIGPL